MSDGTWGPDGPPEEAYSRVTDPERYLSLHAVADRVVDELVTRYEVVPVPVEVVGRWRGGVVRAIELRPADDRDGARLVVITTGFGVVLRAGHAYERDLPECGCDACDEAPSELARDLAEAVDGIATGGLVETRRRRRLGRDPFSIDLRVAGGRGRTSGTVEAGGRFDAIPVGTTRWSAWPERAAP